MLTIGSHKGISTKKILLTKNVTIFDDEIVMATNPALSLVSPKKQSHKTIFLSWDCIDDKKERRKIRLWLTSFRFLSSFLNEKKKIFYCQLRALLLLSIC
ncbi:hypothetical protein AC477_03580 [miscellaneous Crenarchaeota group-1 archaeon SG8-32-1]|uniref:Uncharacterized protein n=1 Tax=miscellaneous Crenarchaeota group-1 archaeon SG8-32-1 TaxID=1685124 RepID=A0A0M0BU49_9ARCH|nr:MAG: hypothetical protein AC477_03580 [miscellaneous Crenarchaeota group-1 archaeon SG8-32-1]